VVRLVAFGNWPSGPKHTIFGAAAGVSTLYYKSEMAVRHDKMVIRGPTERTIVVRGPCRREKPLPFYVLDDAAHLCSIVFEVSDETRQKNPSSPYLRAIHIL
jgi:hypothetical protein